MFNCSVCKQDVKEPENTCGSGYALTKDNEKVCYICCGVEDRNYMINEDKICLYLDTTKRQVTNWPNSLHFGLMNIRIGKHNIARKRYDVYFVGPDNYVWHGVTYGDNTQLCHCKRTKEKLTVSYDTEIRNNVA